MTKPTITHDQAAELAAQIRNARQERQETLVYVQSCTGINCGQLSRFEAGKFKTASKNLQKLCNYLQISLYDTGARSTLGARIDKFASQSNKHLRIAENLVELLESIKLIP